MSKFAHLAMDLPNYANNQQSPPVKLEDKPVRIRIEFPADVGFRFLELDSKVEQRERGNDPESKTLRIQVS
jgi:hypothetical protein